MKPFSEACEQNKHPILEVLRHEISHCKKLLEIGSGTGQHAVFFGGMFPELIWQTSDVSHSHAGIQAWLNETELANVLPPIALDVIHDPWPSREYNAVFSANTTHIMSWQAVEIMFKGIGEVLLDQGIFCLYGPFNYHGRYTSESNARFDEWLKARDPQSGVRDIEAINQLAIDAGMTLKKDYEMPANNRLLVWTKTGV
jgi:cyclopropane fatty-acyl-phospholipid synthase-like methyltransferase